MLLRITIRPLFNNEDLFIASFFTLSMHSTSNGTIGFSSVHTIILRFDGIFQCRLATDSDMSTETRGNIGWTFAYEDEPDLDRIIRFNNPVAPRTYSDQVGVTVSSVTVDGKNVDDLLIGHMVNLSKDNFFDGSSNMPGREPINNLQLHIGNNKDYISGKASIVSQGTGIDEISQERKAALGLETEEKFMDLKKRKIELLESSGTTIDQKRLANLDRSFSYYFMTRLVRHTCIIDKNIYLDPQDSNVVSLMKEKNIRDLAFNADFYSFDGDGLVGHVTGSIPFIYT